MAAVTLRVIPTGHSPDATAVAWAKVRAMGEIQFIPLNPVPRPQTEMPRWVRTVIDWLVHAMAPLAQWLSANIGLVGIATLVLVALIAGWIAWRAWRDRARPRGAATDDAGPEWRPDAAMASALLSDADRLAAEERFDEAVHLLLIRSFDDIARRRPAWLTPASTAREIARLRALPDVARQAFGVITGEVERSRYALHPLAQPDWQRARAAYAAFAVPSAMLRA